MKPSDTRYTDDHTLLRDSIIEAGEIARHFFQGDVESWDKGDNDPVTEADIAIDTLLKERLHGARPEYGWLSEETDDNPARLDANAVWIVDPIDGTRAFVKGRPHFSISGALAVDGAPVAAVVYNPVTEDLFEAQIGGGTRHNGAAVQVTTRTELEDCRMLGDAPMFRHKAWKRKWPPMDIEQRNSIALRMALVACGQWDACLTLAGKSEWDIAAGDLLIKEAGGHITDHRGNEFSYNRETTRHPSLVGAGPHLHQKLVERVHHIELRSK